MSRPLRLFWLFFIICGALLIVHRCVAQTNTGSCSDQTGAPVNHCGVWRLAKSDLDRAEAACGRHRIGFAKVRTSGEYDFIDEPAEYDSGWSSCAKIDQKLVDRHNTEQAERDAADLALIERLTK